MNDKMTPLRAAIAGCGHIAGHYTTAILGHPETLQLMGAFDIDNARVEELAGTFGGKAYPTLDDLLADEEVKVYGMKRPKRHWVCGSSAGRGRRQCYMMSVLPSLRCRHNG